MSSRAEETRVVVLASLIWTTTRGLGSAILELDGDTIIRLHNRENVADAGMQATRTFEGL